MSAPDRGRMLARGAALAAALGLSGLSDCAMREDGIGVDVSLEASLPRGESGLTWMQLDIERVELLTCPGEASPPLALFLAPSRAYAHGGPGEALAPGAVLLDAESAAADLGVLEPRPGRYCDVRLTLRAERTLVIEGWRDGAPVELEVSLARERVLRLEDAAGAPAPLALDGNARSAALAIVLDVGSALAAHEGGDREVAGLALLAHLLDGARAEVR